MRKDYGMRKAPLTPEQQRIAELEAENKLLKKESVRDNRVFNDLGDRTGELFVSKNNDNIEHWSVEDQVAHQDEIKGSCDHLYLPSTTPKEIYGLPVPRPYWRSWAWIYNRACMDGLNSSKAAAMATGFTISGLIADGMWNAKDFFNVLKASASFVIQRDVRSIKKIIDFAISKGMNPKDIAQSLFENGYLEPRIVVKPVREYIAEFINEHYPSLLETPDPLYKDYVNEEDTMQVASFNRGDRSMRSSRNRSYRSDDDILDAIDAIDSSHGQQLASDADVAKSTGYRSGTRYPGVRATDDCFNCIEKDEAEASKAFNRGYRNAMRHMNNGYRSVEEDDDEDDLPVASVRGYATREGSLVEKKGFTPEGAAAFQQMQAALAKADPRALAQIAKKHPVAKLPTHYSSRSAATRRQERIKNVIKRILLEKL